jgi:hypothetical protein
MPARVLARTEVEAATAESPGAVVAFLIETKYSPDRSQPDHPYVTRVLPISGADPSLCLSRAYADGVRAVAGHCEIVRLLESGDFKVLADVSQPVHARRCTGAEEHGRGEAAPGTALRGAGARA